MGNAQVYTLPVGDLSIRCYVGKEEGQYKITKCGGGKLCLTYHLRRGVAKACGDPQMDVNTCRNSGVITMCVCNTDLCNGPPATTRASTTTSTTTTTASTTKAAVTNEDDVSEAPLVIRVSRFLLVLVAILNWKMSS